MAFSWLTLVVAMALLVFSFKGNNALVAALRANDFATASSTCKRLVRVNLLMSVVYGLRAVTAMGMPTLDAVFAVIFALFMWRYMRLADQYGSQAPKSE